MTASAGPSLVTGRVLRLGPVRLRARSRDLWVGVALVVLLAVAAGLALMLGTLRLGVAEVARALVGDGDAQVLRTVTGRRLPRLLTAVLVGGFLALSGSAFQSLSRNALGSPDIIGFTAGAATGAVVQIAVFGGGMFATAAAALVGGLVSAVLVYLLARRDGVSGGMRLVLVGIGIGAVMAAVTQLVMVRIAVGEAALAQLWMDGSLIGRGWPHVGLLAAAGVVLVPLMLALARRLRFMEMGDDIAIAVGIRAERTRLTMIVLAVACSSIAVAAAGPIAFIALAAPQIVVRLTRGGNVQFVLSFLMGAVLLVGADLISAHVDIGLRIPVGLVTAALGGLYLIYLLARRV